MIQKKNTAKYYQNFDKLRTIGISKHNIDYLDTIKINLKKFIWPIKKIKIYNFKKRDNEKINFESSKGVNFFLIK
ncbi:MAG: hypothetical protein VW828_03790, partial [Candidatus Puniceispirillum sp.]